MISSAEVLELAKRCGFDEAGITLPASLEEGETAIQKWTNRGRHGSMQYLQDFSQRKARFFENFPEAKSVIVLGVNYYSSVQYGISPAAGGESGKFFGRVARYAWGKDYHRVIAEKHEELIRILREKTGENFKAKSCVDTQPLPERYAAVRAGLGFVGKHTGLLSQKFGPWLFLSEIVTNLELEEKMAEPKNCGTCVDCQKICPTGALDEDYNMDARRCIAYLTIEHKGVIPYDLRPQVKDWVFGCDECFDACPFTSKSRESSWPELGAQAGTGPWLDFDSLFETASNKEHEKKFAETALSRVNRKQMLRNACLVLGNSGRKEAVPYLAKALEDPAALVRIHAAWGLGRLRTAEGKKFLKEKYNQEQDPEVLEEIKLALEN